MPRLDELYSHLWSAFVAEEELLDRSLDPRSWNYLYDLAAEANLPALPVIADVGCGRGNHTFSLCERLGGCVVGIDLVIAPLVAATHDTSRPVGVTFVQGNLENLPLRTGAVDFVWCRDMLVHVRRLGAAMTECARILKPGGKMLAYVTTETDRMEPREAARLYAPLAIEHSNMRREYVEQCFGQAGFMIECRIELDSETVEAHEERDGRVSRSLMRVAHMRRLRENLAGKWGASRYESTEALYAWGVYMLLGKITSAVYMLTRARSAPQTA